MDSEGDAPPTWRREEGHEPESFQPTSQRRQATVFDAVAGMHIKLISSLPARAKSLISIQENYPTGMAVWKAMLQPPKHFTLPKKCPLARTKSSSDGKRHPSAMKSMTSTSLMCETSRELARVYYPRATCSRPYTRILVAAMVVCIARHQRRIPWTSMSAVWTRRLFLRLEFCSRKLAERYLAVTEIWYSPRA